MLESSLHSISTGVYPKPLELFGYIIDRCFHVDIKSNTIIKIGDSTGEHPEPIKLRSTMMRLLTYLVLNANDTVVAHDDILTCVWENYGLMATHQRMSYVINQLNTKLLQLGMSQQLIKNIHGQGYTLSDIPISVLYGYSK